jgi:hypothetical protein
VRRLAAAFPITRLHQLPCRFLSNPPRCHSEPPRRQEFAFLFVFFLPFFFSANPLRPQCLCVIFFFLLLSSSFF